MLAVLMIAGLALAPVARPVMAEAPSDASMHAMVQEMSPSAADDMSRDMAANDMSVSDVSDEMAADMPCCPSKAPMPVDCDKCVFMAACMSKCFMGMIASVAQPLPIASDRIAIQRSDSSPDSLGHPPPEHPPRILV